MRRSHLLALVGAVLLAGGFALLTFTSVVAQEAAQEPLTDPPYLADYYHAWVASPHADTTAEAFNHWNSEGEVATGCAKCHSGTGYVDFLGGDGSDAGVVDVAQPVGSVVTCDTCHNPAARDLTEVTFPSGATVADAGGSARCMECHQGRESTVSVNAKLTDLGLMDTPDTVNPELGFINIHYSAAAATLYGSVVEGGYQYDGMVYQMKNNHVEGFNTCADCHDPHTTEVKIAQCSTCHDDVETVEDLRYIRMEGSGSDYDGDEDTREGIAEEIEGLQALLYQSIQAYAREVTGTPILYSEATYPYWFVDGNDNGEIDDGETTSDTAYHAFTANLLRAAYNYQVTIKDPAGYAHNPQYMIHLLYDSITSLNASLSDPIDMEFAQRNDPGHFNVTAEAFRHWDGEGEIPGTCAKCHSDSGLPVFVANGTNISVEPSNSLTCTTCHTDLETFDFLEVSAVTFPSGATVSFGEEADEPDKNNLCISCHQGRESTVSVNAAITRSGVGDDEISQSLAFRNVHYFAAGATLFGGDVQGAYQYADKDYNGRFLHDDDEMTTCTDCHDAHTGENEIRQCEDCHDDVETQEDVRLIRMTDHVDLIDYDGDGDDEEPIADEVASFQNALLVALQDYAANTIGTPIAYDEHAYPYFFIDTNGSGVGDPDELTNANRYVDWTPNLLRAAYNYQYAQKDPGAFAHNADYIMQVMYDSIQSVGGESAVANFTRPPVEASED